MSGSKPTRRRVAPDAQRDERRRMNHPFRNLFVAALITAIICLGVWSAITIAESLTQTGEINEAELATIYEDDEGDGTSSAVATDATTVTVSVAGDCTLGTDEYFNYSTSFNAMYESVADPSWFFENVYDIFSEDDLTIVNMEGTLTESTSRADKEYAFKGSAEYAQVLVEGGVEAASLANNHSHDYGEESYTDTIENLEAAGIATFGYDSIDYEEVNGVTVALIGTYELALGIGIEDEMVENIQTAEDEGADIIIVYIHWGSEREYVPDETQIELGHAAIDAGADLVVGSHPHVIQGYEEYNGHYIVYSLGNFCFGGNSNPSDKDCMIIQQTFVITDDGEVEVGELTVIPCSVSSTSSSNNYQPTPAEGDEAESILEKIEESCEAIAELSAEVEAS